MGFISAVFTSIFTTSNNNHSYQESFWAPSKPTVTKTYSSEDDAMYHTIFEDITTNRNSFVHKDNNGNLYYGLDDIICTTCNINKFDYNNFEFIIRYVLNSYGKRYTNYDVICNNCNNKVTIICRLVPS